MLKNNLYTVEQWHPVENGLEAGIRIIESCEILKGHFPSQPVVPGVCQLLMLKELLQEHLGKALMMTEASMVKFLTMLAPPTFTAAEWSIQYQQQDADTVQVQATLKKDTHIFLKFKGQFRTQAHV